MDAEEFCSNVDERTVTSPSPATVSPLSFVEVTSTPSSVVRPALQWIPRVTLCIQTPWAVVSPLETSTARLPCPVIFTLRSEREGGEPVELDDEGIANLCVDVCQSGLVDFVDFEMSAPEAQTRAVLAAARDNDTQIVLSYHNFAKTPGLEELLSTFSNAGALGGDIAKVAVMPRDLDDVLVLLRATLQASRDSSLPLISISMGELGAFTRAIGWYFGSAVTFAAGRQISAPGQLSVEDVRNLVETLARHQAS